VKKCVEIHVYNHTNNVSNYSCCSVCRLVRGYEGAIQNTQAFGTSCKCKRAFENMENVDIFTFFK
jgi:hypothetical protein